MCFSRGWKIGSTNLFKWVFILVSSAKMLEYDRIDISEGIDIKKTNASK